MTNGAPSTQQPHGDPEPRPLHGNDVRSGDVPEALRSDVRYLGGLLGRVLAESGGQELLDDVEKLRALTIGAYERKGEASIEDAEALVAGFTLQRAEQVARAFT